MWTERAEIMFTVTEAGGEELLPAPTLTLDPAEPTSEDWTDIILDQTYDQVRAWRYKDGELLYSETIWYNYYYIGSFKYEPGEYYFIVDCKKDGVWTERAEITFTVTEAMRWAVVLPEGLEEIESEAFRNAGVSTVFIPSGCLSIGDDAFIDSSMTAVYVLRSVTYFGREPFPADTVVYTPSGSTAETWAKEHGYEVVNMD